MCQSATSAPTPTWLGCTIAGRLCDSGVAAGGVPATPRREAVGLGTHFERVARASALKFSARVAAEL